MSDIYDNQLLRAGHKFKMEHKDEIKKLFHITAEPAADIMSSFGNVGLLLSDELVSLAHTVIVLGYMFGKNGLDFQPPPISDSDWRALVKLSDDTCDCDECKTKRMLNSTSQPTNPHDN